MDSNKTDENIDKENFQIKEKLISDELQSNLQKQKMYIKSKDSTVHVGPKFVLEVKNEIDIKRTLKPFLQYLNPQTLQKQLSIDLTDKTNDDISENKKSENDQQSTKNEDDYLENSIIIEEIDLCTNDDSQSLENKFDNCFEKMKINQDENELLLTPEYFNILENTKQIPYSSVSTQFSLHQNYANVNPAVPVSSSNVNQYMNSTNTLVAQSEIQTDFSSKTFKNENLVIVPDNQNKLNSDNFQRQKLRSESIYFNNFPNIQQESFMYQDLSTDFSSQDLNYYSDYIKAEQNSEKTCQSFVQPSTLIKKCVSQYSSSSSDIQDQKDEFRRQTESSTNSSANIPISYSNNIKTSANHFPVYVQNKQFLPKLNQSSLSLPNGVYDDFSFQLYNCTNKKIYQNELPRERLLKRPKCDWIPLGVNFMEANNFRLGIIPGKFYNTENGVLVEMQNGKNYTIFLSNDHEEQCDVDIIVDTEIVGKLRLEGKTTEYLEGPRNSSLKFVFLRARDSPPQAEIMYDDEGNGLIEAIFKPEKINKQKQRNRAWSADSNGPFLQSLHHTFENLFGPKVDEISDSNINNSSPNFRSGKFCAGATALQGEQKRRYAELVDNIEIDENRIVVLQLRLVARTDDLNQPDSNEPIKPLITRRPPPLPP